MKDRNSHFRPPGTRGLPSPQRIAQIANQGGMTARDRFNNVLVEGALVLYHPLHDVIYQIQKVAPVLDPRAQGQFVTVTMIATVPLHMPTNQPCMELTMVGLPATAEQHDELEQARQAAARDNGNIDADIGLRGAGADPDPEGGFKTAEERAELDRQAACTLDHQALAEELAVKGILAGTCPNCDGPVFAKGPDDGESS